MDIGKRTTFWEFVKTGTNSILIPEIQRDYVQGRKTPVINDIRSNFLDDIYSSLKNGIDLDLNFVYGKNNSENDYIPIDGQQRLTTLFLLHLFAFSKEKRNDLLRILKTKLTYKTRTSTREFITKLCENLRTFNFSGNISFFITDAEWFFNEWELDPSIKSMIVMLSEIYDRFNDFDHLSLALTNDHCPISFMLLDIKDIGQENDLYIKMNSRGRPLTSFECFKSELFDYIDKNGLLSGNSQEFKRKIDDDWLNLFWEGFDLKKRSDKALMQTIHFLLFDNYICENNLETFEGNQILQKIEENEFQDIFSFNNYKVLINDDSLKVIEAVFDLMVQSRSSYYFPIIKEDILESFLSENSNKNRHYLARSCLIAIATYARCASFNLTSFEEWYRLSRNLIVSSSNIDKPAKFCEAIKTIYSKYNNAIDTIHPNQDIIDHDRDVPFFFKKDVDCEVLKAKTIIKDSNWLNAIRTIEKNKYLHSSISFMFWFQGINNENIDHSQLNLRDFTDNWSVMELFVDANGMKADEDLFRRGLLTYGDYSFQAGSSRTLFFEGGDRYYDFLRLLNEESSFRIFKLFFDDYRNEFLGNDTKLDDYLENRIQAYNDQSNEFIYWLIKEPALLDYAKQNRYVNSNGVYYLLSKNYLSAEYREYLSYLMATQLEAAGHNVAYHSGRGPLGGEDSRCYISAIDNNPVHIEIIVNSNEIVLCSDVPNTPIVPRVPIGSYSDLKTYLQSITGIAI